MKLLGKFALSFLSLILSTSIILWVLAHQINPETIKQHITNQISAMTHKKSRIDGAISWQLFPRPGLRFSKIILGDEQLKEEYFLSAETLHLDLKISPLLKGQIVFNEIAIDGLTAKINLDPTHEEKPTKESSQALTKEPNTKESYALERLFVNHGQVIINSKGGSTVLKNVKMGIEQFNLSNAPAAVQIKAKLSEYRSNPQIKANLNFRGRLRLAPSLLNQLNAGINQSSVEGQLSMDNALFNQLTFKKISATIKTNKSRVQFNPLTFTFYDGQSVGNMSYSFATKQFSLNQTATNLNGKHLMKVLLGNDMLSGKMDFLLHATIPFEKTSLNTISGIGSISIKNGEIYKLNMDQMLFSMKDKLNRLLNIKFTASRLGAYFDDWDENQYMKGNTPFKLISTDYKFQNGIFNSDSILLQTDKLQVKGKGTINLSNHQLNSVLQLSLNNGAEPTLRITQQILGGYFPLQVTGTLEQPEVLPNFKIIRPLMHNLLVRTRLDNPMQQVQNLFMLTFQ